MIRPCLLLVALSTFVGHAAPYPAAPTFQDLMDPAQFPEPQRGLVVESATVDKGMVRIVSTGAEITVDLAKGEILLAQRIGHQRPVARLRLGQTMTGATVTHRGPGFARVTFAKPDLTIRVNGDSLFMLHAHEALSIAVDRLILPAWQASFRSNHLIADELGAFGLYSSQVGIEDGYDPYATTVATYPLPADEVLWVGVCPPKPYDWDRSLHERVVWHWTRGDAYPSDADLEKWSQRGNLILLQSEVKLWKDWNLDFVPREGLEEFARVRETVHRLGMRFIVYTSPYYFLKGTALEPRAFNSFEGFTNWPPGTGTGENMGLFLAAIRRVMAECQPDGLYFDGQYTSNPAALYALARETRAVVGEEGILEWHSTSALGSSGCYLPQADAYVDIILRGEGRGANYADFDYLRFFVSGYNINNCIGVLCNNGPEVANPDLTKQLLLANGRYHTLVGWLARPQIMATLDQYYFPRLTPALRATVDAAVAERQQAVASRVETMQAELALLAKPTASLHPIWRETFRALPEGKTQVSARTTAPFQVGPEGLRVSAEAHTYAYYEIPLAVKANGLLVRLRQDTDGGMSWGPAAAIRFANGSYLRIGTRADNTLQADLQGQQLYGSTYDPRDWVWLRARWTEHFGVIERSADGKTFTKVWGFQHNGAFAGQTAAVLVGKVPFDGKPHDHSEPGKLGTCEIGEVEVSTESTEGTERK